MVNNIIIASIKKFAWEVTAAGFPVEKAILFGSWAKGKAGKESDIDVCLVSSGFGKDEISELQFLLKKTGEIDNRIEPIPLSTSDYLTNATPLVFEIKKYGQEISL